MDLPDAVQQLRKLVQEFVSGNLPLEPFMKSVEGILGSIFDPLDEALEELNPADAKFVSKVSHAFGGEFGEVKDMPPKKSDWKNGPEQSNYSWIDVEKFKSHLKSVM